MENNKKNSRNVKKNKKDNKKIILNEKTLQEIKESQQVLDMYIEDIDESLNMVGKVGKDIKAIIQEMKRLVLLEMTD